VDGFRFDLMALHDVATMQAIEKALHKINPKAIIYGEGWTGGTSALPSNQQMTQANIFKIEATEGAAGSLAVFSDTIRDGLKGSVFNAADPGYVNGDAAGNAKAVLFGLTGSWYKNVLTSWRGNSPLQVINYTSCHDNLTLWDKLKLSAPDADQQTLLAMNRLCAAAVFGAQGVPFIQAGEEMLRTKDGDHNSYASSDIVNNLKWDVLTPESDEYQMYLYYKGLIAFRKAHAALRQASFSDDWQAQILEGNAVSALFTNGKETVLVVLNPGSDMTFALPEGSWDLYVDDQHAGTQKLNDESLSGEITLEGLSAYIFLKTK
jgi:pullulanase